MPVPVLPCRQTSPVFLIEHQDLRILVDTGETCETRQNPHRPGLNRWFTENSARFRLTRKSEAGPVLEKAGIQTDSITHVIPTHLHQDHMDGMKFFRNSQLYIHQKEYRQFFKPGASMNGYIKANLPENFSPCLYTLDDGPFENFPASKGLNSDDSIRIVGLPGHTENHIGVLVKEDDLYYLFSGDLAFTQQMLLFPVPCELSLPYRFSC